MSRSGAIAALAWRESRTARRRLLLYMSSISLGVAALVAIDSFAANVTRSVREQSRALLGGDISITGRARMPGVAQALLDSVRHDGIATAQVTSFASMAVATRTGATRLAQVHAVSPGYPFYGAITTAPAGRWPMLQQGAYALVDPSLLVSLDLRPGDSLSLGYARFVILGTIENIAGDVSVEAAVAPRVYIAERWVPSTGLLVFGSRADYETLLRLPPSISSAQFVARYGGRFRTAGLRVRTVTQTETSLTDAIQQLGHFLAIVGLVALLLGGIGVASGIHAFVIRKIDTVAVLRCLGATSRQVLAIYVLQAAVMGLVGAVIGAVLGVLVQLAFPRVLGSFLPVDVTIRAEPSAIVGGLLVGLWVALAFALRPLLTLRAVSPLQSLRRDTDSQALARGRRDPWRRLVTAGIVASVVLIAVDRARTVRQGLAFSLGIGVAIAILWLAATLLTWAARRGLRSGWPFVVRQGVANLYRPGNQTRAVVLALGFGVFLVAVLAQLHHSLLRRLDVTAQQSRANLVFFDVQQDQEPGVDSIIRAARYPVLESAPIVPMRIAAVNGKPVPRIRADSGRREGGGWALRREYRSTYRDTLVQSERLVAGRWFPEARAASPRDTLGQVSLDVAVAHELGVKVGDEITWDVQGVHIPTRVTSLREVSWARFEPNFFAVFEPRALAHAPQQFALLANVPGDSAVAELQRTVVRRYPNVSSIDLSLVQRTIGSILDKVTMAVRFLALLTLALAVPVVFSAVVATQRERIREGVLLKTLGATRRQIARILTAEYVLLGALGSLAGVLLSIVAGWALARWVFHIPFAPAIGTAAAIVLVVIAVVAVIGVLAGRGVFRATAIEALREVS